MDAPTSADRRSAQLAELIREFQQRLTSLQSAQPVEPPPQLSFISPCYNEDENLENLCSRIHATCRAANISDYEILLVENGSADRSEELIRRLHNQDCRVKMIQLSRNFGFQGAIACGLAHCRGAWVAVLDADLQDPPELIPRMLEKAREGFDVVYGIRIKRQEGAFKRFFYKLFYRLWRLTSEIQVPLDAGDYGVMSRVVVDTINAMPERHRFMRGLRAFTGFRQTGFAYERHGRAAGESKFNLYGMILLAIDGILSYSVIPLRMMSLSGAIIMVLAVGLSLVQFVVRAGERSGWIHSHLYPPGFAQINLLISFLAGFNILCAGLVGEYAGRIYKEVKMRPTYIIRETLF
jgi:dolichol-phosphate mannosyltransferase